MYKYHIRAYAVLSLTITCFGILAGFNALSAYWLNKPGSLTDFSVSPSVFSQVHYGNAQKLVNFNFNLSLDLTPELNWNVKQAFVYIRANFDYDGHPQEKLLWNKIITRSDKWSLSISDTTEFPIWIGNNDREMDMKLSVYYDISPYSGFIYTRKHSPISVHLPKSK
ncbi:hypothetical protein RCL1_003238 [Eukaryota sp. TZLM3-RCL]